MDLILLVFGQVSDRSLCGDKTGNSHSSVVIRERSV